MDREIYLKGLALLEIGQQQTPWWYSDKVLVGTVPVGICVAMIRHSEGM